MFEYIQASRCYRSQKRISAGFLKDFERKRIRLKILQDLGLKNQGTYAIRYIHDGFLNMPARFRSHRFPIFIARAERP